MDAGFQRFPSLTGRGSTSTIVDQPSDGVPFSETSTLQCLSRFPSLSGTKTPTITASSSTSLNQHSDPGLRSSRSTLAVDAELPSKYRLSIYASLPLPKGDFIRLLCVKPGPPKSPLNCTLFVAKIAEYQHRFTALSYVWGHNDNLAPIFVNGRVQNVRRNLYNFICALRNPYHHMIIWADAVCIDQQSNAEKTHQVKLMHKIYSAAVCTRAWLGDDMPNIAQAMSDFGEGGHEANRATPDSKAKSGTHLLLPLIDHEYWSRTWIIQEILLPKEIWVHCGEQSLRWADLLQLARNSANQPNAYRLLHVQALGECNMMHLHKMRQNTRPRGLPELLQDYGTTMCEDIRDRVFGLIGLIDNYNDPLYINDAVESSNRARDVINYESSPKQLFFQLLRLYHSLPVHYFALPLWTAFELDYHQFDSLDFSRVLQVQGFPCSQLIRTRSHIRTLNQATAKMNLDDTTQAELVSFSPPGDLAETRHSRVCLNIRVKINDSHFSEYYQATACSIEPRGLILGRHGYDLLCHAFDGAQIHRRAAQDQHSSGTWMIKITVAGLKALSVITNPADNQYFVDAIQAEHVDNSTIAADVFQWITAIRQLSDMAIKNPPKSINPDALPPEPISENLLLAERSKHRGHTKMGQTTQPQHAEPAIVDRTKMRHRILKGIGLAGFYNWLTKPIYGNAQFRYG